MRPESTQIPDDDLVRYRAKYQSRGFIVMNNVADHAAKWSRRLLGRTDALEVLLEERHRSVEAGSGNNRHIAFDRFELDAEIPEVRELHDRLVPVVRSIAGPYIIRSPYKRSAYYAKIYHGPTHQQGWHFDTNSATGILYLNNTAAGDGTTEIRALDNEVVKVAPVEGSLLLLNGRRCFHRANPVAADTSKVVIIINFYALGHRLRAPHLDRLIFAGSRDRGDA